MYRQQANILINITMVIDALVVIAAGYLARWFFYTYYPIPWEVNDYHFIILILSSFFINNAVMARLGLYSDQKPEAFLSIMWQVAKAALILFAILAAFLFFVREPHMPPYFLLIFAGLFLLFMIVNKVATASVTEMLAGQGFNQRRILVVGNGDRARLVLEALERQRSWGHRVIGLLCDPEDPSSNSDSSIPVLGTFDDLRPVILEKEVDEVIFALPQDRPHSLQPYLSVCERIGLSVRIVPAMYNPATSNLQVEVLQGVPLLCYYKFATNASGLFYKRILDLVAGGIGTLFSFGILYPLVGLAIKTNSPGPVLFKQARVGMNGRPFHLYKFRSMYVDAEKRKAELLDANEMNGPIFKLANDPRITRVGRFLRKTSLDEFPQFWNVLKGQMSLVGTRPPTPEEVAQYEDWHRRRISIKPGITGLWQISGRNKITDFNEVVKLDLRYIDRWRFSNDLKILWRTFWVVMARKGAV